MIKYDKKINNITDIYCERKDFVCFFSIIIIK